MKATQLTAAALLLTGIVAAPARADQPTPVISRAILFGNPERAQPRLSPDGKRLAWLAPDDKGVLQVWVRTLGQKDDKVVTADKKRGIRVYFWAQDNRTLLYMQDADGDENFHVYGVDLAGGSVRDYTPFQGIRAGVVAVEPALPDTILVSMNVRNKAAFDVYRLDLRTGALVLDTENPGDVDGWIADHQLAVRGAQAELPDGGHEIRIRDDGKSAWRTLLKTGMEDNIGVDGFSHDGKAIYLESSVGEDTTRLFTHDLATGKDQLVAQRKDVDVGGVMIHPVKHHIEAVSFMPGRTEWTVIDPAIKGDFAALRKLSDGDFFVSSRTRADDTWLVGFDQDRGPVKYYTWDRAAKKGTFLFTTQPKLEGLKLAEMKPITIPARDGLKLPAYLTLPAGVAAKKLPLVLLVHGGPWARDNWGFDPYAQWFANRGYAALQVNYRGSDGFGKKFLHAGDKQWGLKMHDDLIDAVNWAVKQGYVDAKRVCIFGGSYGGYAALAGAAFTPDFFKCAVDIVGPSNLFTLLKTIPPYWKPIVAMFHTRMGDPEKDQELLKKASPLFSADKIKIPMLIGQGAHDPRVNQAEAEQIFAALQKNGARAIYVLYSDEGHGFARPENRIDFNARAEKFLSEQLGGRYEPMEGDKVPGSTAVVKEIGSKTSAR